MTGWQPQQDPRQQPAPYGQPQHPAQPGYWQQPPPVQVNVQQNAYGPSKAITQGNLGCIEETVHWTLIVCTCGLWIPVYISRKRSKRSVTRFR